MNYRNEKSKKIFKQAGGQVTPEMGGKPDGSLHLQGGMSVIDNVTGEEKGEIEGGERIFSRKDTQFIESEVQKISQLATQDKPQADAMAMNLGYMMVDMISEQQASEGEESPDMYGKTQVPLGGQAPQMQLGGMFKKAAGMFGGLAGGLMGGGKDAMGKAQGMVGDASKKLPFEMKKGGKMKYC